MGVHYEWDDDRQIILDIQLQAPWTWTEYRAIMKDLMPMLRDLNHPVATTVDCSQMGPFPKDDSVLNVLKEVEDMMPDNLFASGIVAAPIAASMFMNILMKIRPRAKRLAFFTQTIKGAHEQIYARYAELYPDK